MLDGDGAAGGAPRSAASRLARLSEARWQGRTTDMVTAIPPTTATATRPITVIRAIIATATMHRDLMVATTRGGITAISRSSASPKFRPYGTDCSKRNTPRLHA